MIVSPNVSEITPAWVSRFETNVQTLAQDAWARRNRSLIWDKIADVRQSQTGRELLFWLLETAKISKEGFGGNKRFDDIGAAMYQIVNEDSGAGLRLKANEIKDNMMKNPPGMPALDFAASWARQIGGHAAYWPQQSIFDLIKAGTTAKGYDDVAFFSTAHPVNGFDAGAGTYSNKVSGFPLMVLSGTTYDLPAMIKNLASVLATARTYKQPNGLVRDVQWKYIVGDPTMQLPLSLLFETKTFGGGFGFTGINENVVSRWGIEPIIAPELTEAGVCYLIAEALPGEGAAFTFQDREPYHLTSYAMESFAELNRRKEFEWHYDGRNAVAYGHPYLALRIEAS